MSSADIKVGSEWEETARPGHTVKIISSDILLVVYEHIGIHNKRVQRFPTQTEPKRFLQRFEPIDR